MDKKLISFVVPCYKEEENIPHTYQELVELAKTLTNYDYEIIFVDNGSPDKSQEIMRELAAKDAKFIPIFLSRNFGPETTILAGQQHARGDAVVFVEADLQDPVELIPEFIKKWEEGYDIVLGQRNSSDEKGLLFPIRKLFYKILHSVSYIDIPINVGTFSLITKQVNEAMNALPEKNRFGRGIRAWVGFKSYLIQYHRHERKRGKSYYNLSHLLKHAEKGLIGFSTLPLEMLTYLGLAMVLLAVFVIVFYFIRFLVYGNPFIGFSTIVMMIAFFSGIQIMAISIVGKYIAVIFEETKNRPQYIVKEIINYDRK
ncbi:MAG: glycosyltransferase family 2 protein [Candidatus Abawacabacteria bacterium]|nr:glycosyltransferase family 2 protein [Candidatus Abawacabacteria bacterium]